MKIICGLGNPGDEYRQTRHNVGFMVCEILSRRHGVPIRTKKFSARIGQGRIGSESVILLNPETYMNRSGQSVGPALHFYKLALEDLIVIHDEVDLEPGRIQVRVGGGTAGHKGLRSLVQHLSGPDFIRIRFGVGRPENPHIDVPDYVLGKFSGKERPMIEKRLEDAADAVEAILAQGVTAAANEYNRKDFCE